MALHPAWDSAAFSVVVKYTALPIFLLGVVLFFVHEATFSSSLKDPEGNSIPDGPIGLPVVGSFPFLTHYPELTLHHWAQKFGSLYSLWLGNQLVVVLSDPQVVKDLTVTKGAIFSSRKDMFLKWQNILVGRGITTTPDNATWRKHRRLASKWLNKSAIDGHDFNLNREALVLVQDIYRKGQAGTVPINVQHYAGRYSLNNMLTITFGTRTESNEDPLIARALYLSREFMNCTGPVSNLTDYLPILQVLPNSMVTRSRRLHQDLLDTYGGMIHDINGRIKEGEEVPDCAAKTLLESRDKENLDWLDIAMFCSGFMIGGVETTAAILQWFTALVSVYPEIQAKAHAELDQVLGRDRLPTIEDERNLPYIRALIKEVERCGNPFWLGTPHYTTQDCVYRGQFIPKDTLVITNTYTIHHDPRRYPAPFTFNPDRYIDDSTLSSESAHLANPYERDHWTFGVGRRICPGMLLAEREIWLGVARILWAFRIEQVPGEPIDLKEYDGLSGRSPVPFKITMIPRHENVAKVLNIAAD